MTTAPPQLTPLQEAIGTDSYWVAEQAECLAMFAPFIERLRNRPGLSLDERREVVRLAQRLNTIQQLVNESKEVANV